MKKFQFALDPVKSFKDQELEERKRHHGQILVAIRQKEEYIEALEAEHTAEVAEFNRKKQEGVTVIEAQSFDIHIRRLQKNIEHERKELQLLYIEEQDRRAKVVEKKQEISSIEKLRERRVEEYNKAAQKEEENFIEEIVLNKRAVAN